MKKNHQQINDENMSTDNNWKDKVWMTLGDSITFSNMYQPVVNAELNFSSIINKGVSGQSVSTMMDNVTPQEVLYADLITIYGCLNNFTPGNYPIGKLSDIPNKEGTTFISMLKYTIEQVFIADPLAKLVIIGTHNAGDSFRPSIYQPVNGTDNVGDYVLAMGAVARYYGCHFIDLYHESGFNAFNLSIFTTDGAHLSKVGAERIGEVLVNEFLKI